MNLGQIVSDTTTAVRGDYMWLPDGAADSVSFGARAEIYGLRSWSEHAAGAAQATSPDLLLVGAPGVKIAVMLCLVGYLFLFYHYRGYFNSLARTVVSKLYDNIHFEGHNKVLSLYLNQSRLLGILVLALYAVKIFDIIGWTPVYDGYRLSGSVVLLTVIAALVCVIAFQRMVLRLAGRVTLSRALIDRLIQTRRNMFALLTMALTPPVLMFMYCGSIAQGVFKILIAVIITFVAILVIYKSYKLFRDQKVSILDWFLYLCAVEIFPVSFFILAVLRSE